MALKQALTKAAVTMGFIATIGSSGLLAQRAYATPVSSSTQTHTEHVPLVPLSTNWKAELDIDKYVQDNNMTQVAVGSHDVSRIYKAINDIYSKMQQVEGVERLPPFPAIYVVNNNSQNAETITRQNFDPKAPHYFPDGNACAVVINSGMLAEPEVLLKGLLPHEVGHIFYHFNPRIAQYYPAYDPVDAAADVKSPPLLALVSKVINSQIASQDDKELATEVYQSEMASPYNVAQMQSSYTDERIADRLAVLSTHSSQYLAQYLIDNNAVRMDDSIRSYYHQLLADPKYAGRLDAIPNLKPDDRMRMMEVNAVVGEINFFNQDIHPSDWLRIREVQRANYDIHHPRSAPDKGMTADNNPVQSPRGRTR